MAKTTYTYNITNDLPGGKVHSGNLHTEIEASGITTVLKGINTNGGGFSNGVITGGTLKIVFADALSAGDKTTLDNNLTGPSGGLLASNINVEESIDAIATSTTNTSTTSSTDVLVNSMSIPSSSLPSGTYAVWFNGSVEHSENNATSEMSIYQGTVAAGTQIASSERQLKRGASQGDIHASFACFARITVSGSETIEAAWRTDNATVTMHERTLYALRVE